MLSSLLFLLPTFSILFGHLSSLFNVTSRLSWQLLLDYSQSIQSFFYILKMEVKSCCIKSSYYCIWLDENGFFLEDMNYERKIFISLSSLQCLEASLVELHFPMSVFFQKKGKMIVQWFGFLHLGIKLAGSSNVWFGLLLEEEKIFMSLI